jgi:hypothetical protein
MKPDLKTNNSVLVRAITFAMLTAPIVQLIADILWFGNGVILIGTVFRQISYTLFIPAVLGAANLAPSKTVGAIAMWLCLFGIGGGIAIVALYRIGSAADVSHSGLPHFVEEAFTKNPAIGLSIFIPGILFPLGHVVFSIAFLKGSRPHLLSIIFLASGILFFMGNALEITVALFTSDLLMTIVYSWMAKKNMRQVLNEAHFVSGNMIPQLPNKIPTQ